MFHKFVIGVAAVAALSLSTAAFSQGASGTAAEAKAMLEKAVAAVKADKAKALTSFNAGTDGFKDRDLYPFCFNIADGVVVAGPAAVKGKDSDSRATISASCVATTFVLLEKPAPKKAPTPAPAKKVA